MYICALKIVGLYIVFLLFFNHFYTIFLLMRKVFVIFLAILFVFNYAFTQTQTFTLSGSFTVPAGVTSIYVEAWGAGGAGGSAVGNATPQYRAVAGGGGGGAFVSGTIVVTPGQVINYTVAPNTGENTTSGILNGGNSTFGTVTAPGGFGGVSVNASGGNIGGAGGAGGTGTKNGGNGGSSVSYSGGTSGRSAGGGGGAGTTADGGNGGDYNTGGSNTAGSGGASNGGNGGNGVDNGTKGSTGSVVGGGGSGAFAAASASFRNGGAGARGEIRITYTPLPIKISSFEIVKQSGKSVLTLITASETNNDYFTIERSGDGRSYDAIGEIDGSGDSRSEIKYTFTDERPLPGINYYRIKQTDFDGRYDFSEVRAVRHSRGNLVVTPRTTEGRLQVVTDAVDYSLEVFNTSGHAVKTFMSLSQDQSISIEDLTAGIYYIRTISGGHTETIRIVKM